MAQDNPQDNSQDGLQENPLDNPLAISPNPAPRLSVLMPLYNGERFLPESLESVLSQTFTDFELLIVDDGSSDGSAEIVRSFCARDKRIRVFFLGKNFGISTAINRGLHEARAPLVARMDCDDYCAPSRFAEQVSYMDKHADTYMLGSRAVNIDEFGDKIEGTGNYHIIFAMGHRQIANHIARGKYPLLHATLVYRTSILRALGGYREAFSIGEDDDLYERMFVRYGRVFANLPSVLYFYRRISSSNTRQYDLKMSYWLLMLIRHSSEFFRHGLPDPIDTVKHLPPPPPILSSKVEFIIMELVFYLHEYRILLYRKSLPPACHLQFPANNARRFSMIMSKLSRLPKGSKTREFFYRRAFLLLPSVVPFAKDKREDFLRSFDDAIFNRDGFLDRNSYSQSCLIVARCCLSFGERDNFKRYMFMALRINFFGTLSFIFARLLAHLIK